MGGRVGVCADVYIPMVDHTYTENWGSTAGSNTDMASFDSAYREDDAIQFRSSTGTPEARSGTDPEPGHADGPRGG
jgi:hypothetical protein